MSIVIGICDDMENDRSEIRMLVEDFMVRNDVFCEIKEYSSCEEYLEWDKQADILLLDEELQGMSGLELKDKLSWDGVGTIIMFVTGHDEIVREGYGVNVIGFMKKPIDKEWFDKKMGDAVLILSRRGKLAGYGVPENSMTKHTESDNILYISANDKITKIHFKDGLTKNVFKPLKSYAEELGDNFFMTDRAYYINLRYAGNIINENVGDRSGEWIRIVDTDRKVPLARRRKKAFELARRNYKAEG